MRQSWSSKLGTVTLQLLGRLPLAWLRLLGCLLGSVLYPLAVARRRITQTNLHLCFPQLSKRQIRVLTFRVFIHFAQAWLDRGWLWHAPPDVVRRRLKLTGAVNEFQGTEPVVIFAPHFVGLDAGWTALTQQLSRQFTTIYTDQKNKVIDAWMLSGRQRFGQPQLFGRVDGVKNIVTALRRGAPLYLLPDMNFGPEESIFVPFYGFPAATVPSLSRFARLGRAKVVPVITRMTPDGYVVQVMPSWQGFPTDDMTADTILMNLRLQSYIDSMPDQYFWVHKRFKDRPPGAAPVY
jgi:KDO2-lipid IV(A) lauroyltransferase